MGSCIGKCKPKKRSKEEADPCRHRHVHDKLVIISKDPPPIEPEITFMPSDKPLSPAPSAASFSSFSYSAINKSATASSISSSSSSLSSSSSSSSYSSSVLKDRSFSNDFLWSCVKENPHLIGLHGDSKNVVFPSKIHPQIPTSPSPAKKKPTTVQENTSVVNAAPTPKKRARASSPTLVRQKSFRKEQNFVPSRRLRSPSPSRRFNGESNRIFPVKESYYSKPAASRESYAVSSAPRRESFRAPTPSRKRELSAGGEHSPERSNDELLRHVSSTIDDGKGLDDDVVMEDIHNPLIALDCFIFL